jgi:hypothetical protein
VDSFQASACSRPPLPTTRIFIGKTPAGEENTGREEEKRNQTAFRSKTLTLDELSA